MIITLFIFGSMIIISILGIINLYYVKNEMLDYIDKSKICIDNGDYEGASVLCGEMDRYWDEKHDILILYIRHYDIDEISKVISSSAAFINPDKKDDYHSNMDNIKNILDHLWASEFPSLTGIL